MIHKNLIKNYKHADGTFWPNYNKYCLSNVPPTIEKILGVKTKRPFIPIKAKSEKVVLLFLDGLGFNQWDFSHPVIEAFSKTGEVFPITTIFPSTTSAGVNTMHTGLTPQEHALFEWRMYFEEYDMIITTLPFVSDYDSKRFAKIKPNPEILFWHETIYEKLKREGIKSYVFVSKTILGVYSKLAHKGAIPVPYNDISDLFMQLKQKLVKPEKAYYFVYYDGIDSLSHAHGPFSGNVDYEKRLIFTGLKKLVEKLPADVSKSITLIISADHGQIAVDSNKTVFLNRYEWFDKMLRKSKNDRLIQPYGSPRDVFIQVKPEKLDEAKEKLKLLNADTVLVKDMIKQGLFGINMPSPEFLSRAGDILILPRNNNMIWYKHTKTEEVNFCGMHGGLTQDEMIIPFAIVNLGELSKAIESK